MEPENHAKCLLENTKFDPLSGELQVLNNGFKEFSALLNSTGVECLIVGRNNFHANKSAAGRAKDLADLQALDELPEQEESERSRPARRWHRLYFLPVLA